MATQEWKRATNKFKNIVVEVEMEKDATPWTPIFKIKFKFKTTPEAVDHFDDDINKLHLHLAKDVLGIKPLEKAIYGAVPSNWRLYLVVYGYEHNPKQIKFGRQSDFQVDAFIIAPDKFEKTGDGNGHFPK